MIEGKCRLATTLADRQPFVRLWAEYLKEHFKLGSPLLATERNLRRYREIFDQYLSGQLDGITVFWTPEGQNEPRAVVMGGEEPGQSQWDTNRGKLAMIWGVYVEPPWRGQRVGLQMEQYGRPHLLLQGFEGAVTTVQAINPLGNANWKHWHEAWGVHPVETRIIASLTGNRS